MTNLKNAVRSLRIIFALGGLALLGACGNAAQGTDSSPLQSISITPAAVTITAAQTRQFTATGQYDDGTSATLTTQVTWSSSNAAIATINAQGIATGITSGAVTITAKFGPISGSATLTVTSQFSAVVNYGAGTNPFAVATGDFDKDGKVDLAVANNGSANISILRGTGMGIFGAATNVAVGSSPQSIAVGDFNGDGHLDLVTANFGGNNVSVVLGTGTGTFGGATPFTAGTNPVSVAVADFNADGKLDLAVANINSNNVSILIGTGTGSFGAAINYGVGSLPISVATGDFNADGKPDLVVANSSNSSGSISILLGTGNGVFGAASTPVVAGSLSAITVGDFNLDGKADVAVTGSSSSGTNNNVAILLGIGTGALGAATHFVVGMNPTGVKVGDFNADGKPDLAVVNTLSNNVSVLLGSGSGTFGTETHIAAGAAPTSVAIADFNADGKSDFAAANSGGANVSVLLNITFVSPSGTFKSPTNFGVGSQPSLSAVGDFNGDGKRDLVVANPGSNNISILTGNGAGGFNTAINFPAGTNPTSVAVGDFDGDGKSDLVVTNNGTANANVSLLLGDGAGGFSAATPPTFAAGISPFFVAVGDFDSNGKSDLAVVNYIGNFNSESVSILLGTATGFFGAPTLIPVVTTATPISLVIGDFNADGKSDLAVLNYLGNDVSILLGNGSGSFAAATNFPVGQAPRSVATGDFNADGKLDLAVANIGSGIVSILLGTGTGSFGTPANFLLGTQLTSVTVGDINADGKLDLAVASSGVASVLLGTGTGSFGAATGYPAGNGSAHVVISDFNSDSRPDLAVTNGGGNVSILINQ